MNTLLKKISLFAENQNYRYFGYPKLAGLWLKNARKRYRIVSLRDAAQLRTSDTLFIVGSGPSIKRVSSDQWAHVRRHDSFGINYSFLLDFVPKFQTIEDDRTPLGKVFYRPFMEGRFGRCRDKYRDTVMFITDRHVYRYIHPRFVPALFPDNPIVCVYEYPSVINFESDRPFKKEDFRQTVIYRGSLTGVLHVAFSLGYKKIVLLGVDLQTSAHFFDDMPEMKPYLDEYRKSVGGLGKKYESMVAKGEKYRTMQEYLYALNDLYCVPREIELNVGNKDNILADKIRIYQWGDA